jgi:ribosomal protein S18 acetylase RimI-like enzyme
LADPRSAALAFMHETRVAVADRVEEHPLGTLLITPSLDRVWSLNALTIEGGRPEVQLDDVAAALAEHFPAPGYASAVIFDGETSVRIEAQARERGWQVEHEVVMDLRRDPDRIVDTPPVREGSREEMLALADRWFAEDFEKQGPEALAQLSAYARREWDARPTRAFVAGDAEAMTKLWSDGTTAQVEDVYTAPEARGHGYARALVTHALVEARAGDHDLVFIVADDDDTPKELYTRLGFDSLTRMTRVVRAEVPG